MKVLHGQARTYNWRTTDSGLTQNIQSYVKGRKPVGQVWVSDLIWGTRPDFSYCQTVAGLLVWGALSDERMGLPYTIAAGSSPAQSFSGPNPARLMTTFNCLRFETPNLEGQLLVTIYPRNRVVQLYHQALGRATVEVFEPPFKSESKSHCDWRSVSQSVSQSVTLGVKPNLALMTRYLLLFWQLRSCYCGAPTLTRGRVCLLSKSLSAVICHLS
jgi:hypothetical protein